jgi:hypothetical protein
LAISVGEAFAEIYIKRGFSGCSSPAEGTPGFDEGRAECNGISGGIGAYAYAFIGAAGANALQHWYIPITPPDSDTQVDINVNMIIAHGCVGVGAPQGHFPGHNKNDAIASFRTGVKP